MKYWKCEGEDGVWEEKELGGEWIGCLRVGWGYEIELVMGEGLKERIFRMF